MRFSHSLVELHDINGFHVGYSRVTETSPDGTKKVYEFENFSDHPDLAADKYMFDPGTGGGRTNNIPNNEPPFSPDTYQGWKRGRPKKTQIIDSGGKLLKETNNYQYGYATSSTSIIGRVVEKDDNDYNCNTIPQQDFRVSDYELISENQFLTSYNEINYVDDNSATKNITTTTNLGYTNNGFLTSKTVVHHDGSEYKTTYKFPFQFSDFISSPPAAMAGIMKLKDEHVWSVPIETVNFKKDGSKFYAYSGTINLFNEDFKTSEVKSFESSELLSDFYISGALTVGNFINHPNGGFGYHPNYESRVTYNYLTNGNLSSQVTSDNVTTQYLWGYNNNYITAEIVNPGTDERRTNYTYVPMVGVSSETGPNGYTVNYEYDERNRIQLIKDDDGNIVQAYDYNYNSPPFLSVSPGSLTFTSSGSGQTFNVQTNVSWNISSDAWINTSFSGNLITVSPTTNTSTSSRQGNVTISDASGSGLPNKIVSVTQQGAPPDFTLIPNYFLEYSGDPIDLTIDSNTDWDLIHIQYYTTYDWITPSPSSYSGGPGITNLHFDTDSGHGGSSAEIVIQSSDGSVEKKIYVNVY